LGNNEKARKKTLSELKKNGAKYILYMPKKEQDGQYHFKLTDINNTT
jgi:hypothetical protein